MFQVTGPHDPVFSSQSLDLKAEPRQLRLSHDDLSVRLYHAQLSQQIEVQSRQIEVQIRQSLQRDMEILRQSLQRNMEVLQQSYGQVTNNYKSLYEEAVGEMDSLKDEIRGLQETAQISDDLIAQQKQLIGMYESQQHQQHAQYASHLAQGGPLLPQYQESYSSPYQHPPRGNFLIDTATFRTLSEFGGPLEPTCDVDTAIPTSFPHFDDHLPMQAGVHPTSAARDAPAPSYDRSGDVKEG
jgi:hypothetical protein